MATSVKTEFIKSTAELGKEEADRLQQIYVSNLRKSNSTVDHVFKIIDIELHSLGEIIKNLKKSESFYDLVIRYTKGGGVSCTAYKLRPRKL